MATPYVARFTKLHAQLWAPYGITAYPHGFHEWPEGLADPVWIPTAYIITRRGACYLDLGDCASLDDAIDACWRHFASLN